MQNLPTSVIGLAPVTLIGEPEQDGEPTSEGLKEGDIVVRVGERSYPGVEEVSTRLSANPRPSPLKIERLRGASDRKRRWTRSRLAAQVQGQGGIGVPLRQDLAIRDLSRASRGVAVGR